MTDLLDLNLAVLEAHATEPRLFALDSGDDVQPGRLLVIDTVADTVTHEIQVGAKPTDLVVDYPSNRLFVINYRDHSITRIELDRLEVLETFTYPNPGNFSQLYHANLAASSANRLYFTDGRWDPRLHILDKETGAELGVFDSVGVGDIAVSADGNTLYLWRQEGWTAGSPVSQVSVYDCSTDNLSLVQSSPLTLDRDPLDTPLLLTKNGSQIVCKNSVFNAADVTLTPLELADNIYAQTQEAKILFGSSHVYNAINGHQIYSLPFTTSVMAVSGDQQRLYLHQQTSGQLQAIAMSEIVTAPAPAANPTPVGGETIILPLDELSWDFEQLASNYNVYFGTDSTTVATANVTSPEFLASVQEPFLTTLPTLRSGSDYFWRVDTVGAQQTTPGDVWSFAVFPFTLSPESLELSTVAGANRYTVEVQINSLPVASFANWELSENIPWLRPSQEYGQIPDTIEWLIDATNLSPGEYQGDVHFVCSNREIDWSVSLTVAELAPTKLVADYERPYVYGIQSAEYGQDHGLLLFINTDTEQIEKTIPIDRRPTDLDINHAEGRLYVANWDEEQTFVVDLETQTLLPPLLIGDEVYVLNHLGPGRIIYEDNYSQDRAYIIDTATGSRLGSFALHNGDGESSPAGDFYYHCDNNYSAARLHKYDTTTNTPQRVAYTDEHPYGLRNLVLCEDGSTMFWEGYIYDSDLNELGSLGSEIYATTKRGELAFGASQVFNVEHQKAIYNLPFESQVSIVSGDQEKVFFSSNGALHVIPMNEIANIPTGNLNPVPGDGQTTILPLAQLTWDSDPVAAGYDVFFSTSAEAVTAANTDSPEYLGRVTTSAVNLPESLVLGETYFWRLDVVRYSQVLTGDVWSFKAFPLSIDPRALELATIAGVEPLTTDLTIGIEAVPGITAWTLTEQIPWLVVDHDSGGLEDVITATVDPSELAPGDHTGVLHLTAGDHEVDLPVNLSLCRLSLSMLETDYDRPYLYGLHPGSDDLENAFLVFINAETEALEKALPMGANPTDMDINYFDRRLYVINYEQPNIRVVDLDTQTELSSIPVEHNMSTINHLGPGRVIYEQDDSGGQVYTVDTTTGESSYVRRMWDGDAETSPLGDIYYHHETESWGGELEKYDTSTESFELVASSLEALYRRQKMLLSGDGTTLFRNGVIFDQDLNRLGWLGTHIYATTLHGELAFGATEVFDVASGHVVCNLPFDSQVSAVSGDQTKAFFYSDGGLYAIPMSVIANIPPYGLNPIPADGETTALPLAQLSWDLDPLARSYDVFFGTDAEAVGAADTNSPEYLGQVTTSSIDLETDLTLGTTYYWRVDVIGLSRTTTAEVWSFTAFPLSLDPTALSLATVTEAEPRAVSLTIGPDAAPGVTDWTLNHDIPWLVVDVNMGAVPGIVTFTVDPAGLPAGDHTGVVHLSADGYELDLPIHLDLIQMSLSKLIADNDRPYIYGLHPGSGDFENAYIVFINTDTETVEKAIPIGKNPTDMDINSFDNRMYVTNWQRQDTRIVDLETQTEVAPLQLGTNVYRINHLGPNRIVCEDENDYFDARIVDTTTGDVLGSFLLHGGDGESSPSGNVYYHCDSNTSAATLHKYDTVTNSPQETATSPRHSYGSRNLVMSHDGSTLFWVGYVYDEDLNELGYLGQEIYATTSDGQWAFAEGAIYSVADLTHYAPLPLATQIMAVTPDSKSLYMFDSVTGTIEIFRLDNVSTYLQQLDAERHNLGAFVTWQMNDNAPDTAYNVFRQLSNGQREQVNEAPLYGDNTFEYYDTRAPHQSCEYWIQAVTKDKDTYWFGPATLSEMPLVFGLAPNYPNPFNPETTCAFVTTSRGQVRLTIYDLRGQAVATLLDEVRPAGHHSVVWNGRDHSDHPVASGTYLMQLRTEEGVNTRKLLLAK